MLFKYFLPALNLCIVKCRNILILFKGFDTIRIMEGLTVSEIAKELGISVDATRKRIETAEVKPITREALYDRSILKVLADVKMGRPKKNGEKK